MSLRVTAIVAAYNEADIIEQTCCDLIKQGIGVYLLDNGSTDGTAEQIRRWVGRGVIAVEAFPPEHADTFEWQRILHRKEELARILQSDWFIHQDADEFREGPWPHLSLHAAIERVDALGFNAIDFECLEFRPDHDRGVGSDVRAAFRYYEPTPFYNRVQIRCWKNTGAPVDLVSSGGHEARFPDRRVFPIRFVLRHYPIRGQAHGERKVFKERQGRFVEAERDRGWHIQYDGVKKGDSFIRERSELTPYDPDEVRLRLSLQNREVEDLTGQLETVAAALEARIVSLEEMEASLETFRRESQLAHEELDFRAATIDALQNSVAAEQRRIADIVNSASWRWTAIGRAAYRKLTGLEQ